jgi:hypothetical protein
VLKEHGASSYQILERSRHPDGGVKCGTVNVAECVMAGVLAVGVDASVVDGLPDISWLVAKKSR